MVCVVIDEETRSIGVASTLEPAAAVNLEYLSTALEVQPLKANPSTFILARPYENTKS